MILSVSGLSFGVGVKNILNNVTFGIEEGDRLGIVGVNGSGKSTLLKLLCGEYSSVIFQVAGVHGGGSPIMEDIAILGSYDLKSKINIAKHLAGIEVTDET